MQKNVLLAEPGIRQRAGKYLVFRLGQEEFGVQVMKVKEIIGLQEITSVPQTPDFLRGVINLRGKVIPVVDLRLKFKLASAACTERTCIIVLQVQHESGIVPMGTIVDGVSEVLHVPDSEIQDTPEFADGASRQYILGLARSKSKVRILLDIDAVMTSNELTGLVNLSKEEDE